MFKIKRFARAVEAQGSNPLELNMIGEVAASSHERNHVLITLPGSDGDLLLRKIPRGRWILLQSQDGRIFVPITRVLTPKNELAITLGKVRIAEIENVNVRDPESPELHTIVQKLDCREFVNATERREYVEDEGQIDTISAGTRVGVTVLIISAALTAAAALYRNS